VRGNVAGAVYVSLTVEEGPGEGQYATGTASGLYDEEFDIDADGNFEILLSASEPPGGRNWLKLTPTASRVTTRHYFEDEVCAAADPSRHVPMTIEAKAPAPIGPGWDADDSVAALQRVINVMRSETLEQPRRKPEDQPAFVSSVPNQFTKPVKPGDLAFSAMDIAYAMAPYGIGPDQALVMTGRFPKCRFANVNLWNRYIQSYDFNNRQVSLNRKQVQLEADGSYRIVIAHQDPGCPNWIDTEGRMGGIIYWRFLLPEEEVDTPQCEVVAFAEIARA